MTKETYRLLKQCLHGWEKNINITLSEYSGTQFEEGIRREKRRMLKAKEDVISLKQFVS